MEIGVRRGREQNGGWRRGNGTEENGIEGGRRGGGDNTWDVEEDGEGMKIGGMAEEREGNKTGW